MFENFIKELKSHSDGAYHRLLGPLDRAEVAAWSGMRGIQLPECYVDFLCLVGPGSFFGGSLVIFPLSGSDLGSVESQIARLKTLTGDSIIPFGYGGTTESCFCFLEDQRTDAVYWFSWAEKKARLVSKEFSTWIESQPKELYNKEIYAGYKKLKDVDRLVGVMEQRAAFKVRLLSFEKELRRHPNRPADMLKRYNKVTLEIVKMRAVDILELTLVVARLGSSVGEANIEYAVISVHDLPVGRPVLRECFVFDPFNLSFDSMSIIHNPIIDLGSKMRVKYKEIAHLLV